MALPGTTIKPVGQTIATIGAESLVISYVLVPFVAVRVYVEPVATVTANVLPEPDLRQ